MLAVDAAVDTYVVVLEWADRSLEDAAADERVQQSENRSGNGCVVEESLSLSLSLSLPLPCSRHSVSMTATGFVVPSSQL